MIGERGLHRGNASRRLAALEQRIAVDRRDRDKTRAARVLEAWLDAMTIEDLEFLQKLFERQDAGEPVKDILTSLSDAELDWNERLAREYERLLQEDEDQGRRGLASGESR